MDHIDSKKMCLMIFFSQSTFSIAKFGRTLLLTAHPDDEVMFFSPIIIPLIKAGVEIFGLSLSEGL